MFKSQNRSSFSWKQNFRQQYNNQSRGIPHLTVDSIYIGQFRDSTHNSMIMEIIGQKGSYRILYGVDLTMVDH